jgi:hypothetical protein
MARCSSCEYFDWDSDGCRSTNIRFGCEPIGKCPEYKYVNKNSNPSYIQVFGVARRKV